MAERDENGRLQKGHGGLKPKGAKSEKTKQWEELHESIVGVHADKFNSILQQWADSYDPDEQAAFVDAYMKILEYFKPKQARTVHAGEQNAPVQITISDKI